MNKGKNLTLVLFSACVLVLGIPGCQRSEAPEKTQADVAKAQVEGEKDVAESRHDAAERTMDAEKDLNKASADLAHESAVGQRSVVVAEAESAHAVAVEKCETLTGDARSDCKKQADVDLDKAKMMADTKEQMADPKR